MIFDLSTNNSQQAEIVVGALARCDFPWEWLKPKLKRKTGRLLIPVEWGDLARFRTSGTEVTHGHGHVHVHHNGDTGHGTLDARGRILGLAWYSGKISLDHELPNDPQFAQLIFLSEAAHMTDFFYMTKWMRKKIFAAYHPGLGKDELAHHEEHGWFEESGNEEYWSWVGESYMDGFIEAFTDIDATSQGFMHRTTPEIGDVIRKTLLRVPRKVFGTETGDVFHDEHAGIPKDKTWRNREDAIAEGRAPCGVCLP